MRFEEGVKLDFSDVLIRPKRSTLGSRSEIDLVRSYRFRHSGQSWSGVPIMAANMDHTGTLSMAQALGRHQLVTALSKFISKEDCALLFKKQPDLLRQVFISAGIGDEELSRLTELMDSQPFAHICLDVANGYSERFVAFVRQVREAFPHTAIMAGNVVTGEMVEELILSGADIVKIGIGPGSVCTTREKAGVGYPQLSAIIECADAAHGLGGLVCADGGCVVPGDVVKAFAAGADFVMLGGLFAGHDECLGDIVENNGVKTKRFYGMSSKEAMMRYQGGVPTYRASEGRSVDIPYRGPVEPMILEILGGLRSACTYVGARRLKELSKCTTFIHVNRQLNEVFRPYQVS